MQDKSESIKEIKSLILPCPRCCRNIMFTYPKPDIITCNSCGFKIKLNTLGGNNVKEVNKDFKTPQR